MQYIKLRSRGSSVSFLQELYAEIGYKISSSGCFGWETGLAVNDFQNMNRLEVDGEVGITGQNSPRVIIVQDIQRINTMKRWLRPL